MLPNISQIEFSGGSNPKFLYFTECDVESNRPSKVKRLCLETLEQTSVFIDNDPTHYIDIGVTKDQKFLVISSNTKEDSEIWVLPREGSYSESQDDKFVIPIKIVPR